MPADITIYTTRVCPYCVAAKRLLKERGAAYREIDVTGDDAKRAWLVETTGRRTVPQIFFGEEAIGGYDDLAALDKAGRLREKLAG
ncbi:MAG TPA: glutaredoxin 3 [Polyangiaceae bacterium]|jgi:glutaredoxin 3|nr:glutaredoxin 3 [Polyangiaceae bacterium]